MQEEPTVLLITSEPSHKLMYQNGLAKQFCVEFATQPTLGSDDVDAIVYDIPSVHETLDISWLRRVELPVVVLTPEARLRVANGPRCRILTYPVRPEQIVKALAELGVEGQTE